MAASLVKVYSWLQYDAVSNQRTPVAYVGTLKAIKAAKGRARMETERFISPTWLDENGFYHPRSDNTQP
jgi:hypothetical protein